MAERRKNRKKKDQIEPAVNDAKPSKEEYAVAKYLREKLPEKKTSLLGHKVDYFIASKAIDCLLDSQWATKSDGREALFTTRDSIVLFMDRMLQHKFFHRAKKIIIQKEPKKKKKEEETATESVKEKGKPKEKDKLKDKDSEKEKPKDKSSEKEKGKEKEQEKEKDSTEGEKNKDVNEETEEKESKKTDASEEKQEAGKGDDKKEAETCEKKKEKKKLKLDMHMEQIFLDGSEVYVWIYDPIPMRTWIIGMLMVVGAVLVCLFPLWPQVIRHYIYYISVAAALFLVFIIGLAIIRLIVFVIIWALTFGKHHLWLLPNLTADVGFFESFWPLYEYEYKGKKEQKKEKDKEKKNKTSTESAKEKTEAVTAPTTERSDSSSDQEKKGDQANNSESEQESEDEKSKAENGDNGFEILEKNEAEEIKEQHLEEKQPA